MAGRRTVPRHAAYEATVPLLAYGTRELTGGLGLGATSLEVVAVDTARALVAHDLHGRWADRLEAAVLHRRWWLDQWPDGEAYVPGLLAQDVQEAVHEELDPLWPLCPTCRDHALFIEPDLGADAFWVCHRTGLPVAEVGRLPG